MTTIGASIGEPYKGNTTMGYKRIIIYRDQLREYIDLIGNEIEETVKPQLREFALNCGAVPFRYYEEQYHIQQLSRVTDSAMLLLAREKETITPARWNKYVEMYKNIAMQGKPTGRQEGIEIVQFFEEDEIGKPDMVDLAKEIGLYLLELQDEVRIPYLMREGEVSYKIPANLAIIHAGTKLKEKQNSDITSN